MSFKQILFKRQIQALRQANFRLMSVLAGLCLLMQMLVQGSPTLADTAPAGEKRSCCRAESMPGSGSAIASRSPAAAIKAGTKIAADSKDGKTENKDSKAADKAAAERKPVLEPANIAGFASFGYAAAKNCPEVMEKLFCYCGCDLTDSHTSLLDCFTSLHGVDCHICQEEALLAMKLNKDGVSIKEIQKTVDEKYSTQYPFESDTATYKKYKTGRLYTSGSGSTDSSPGTTGDASSQTKSGTEVAGPEAPEETSNKKKPKLKPGKKPGNCCAGEHKEDAKDSKGSKDSKDSIEKNKE